MTEFLFHFIQRDGPLLVSMPHVGTQIPESIAGRLTTESGKLTDTDWHLDWLYDFLEERGVSVLMANYNRTVIDLNRDADGGILYPGKSETELCPITSFDNKPLYKTGCEPSEKEILHRKKIYWQPYHDKLRSSLDWIKKQYGYAMLWEAHSIQAQVPRFFEGQLPDLNLGNGDGTSCSPALAEELLSIAEASPYSAVLNGRFKGGYITRHYGDPAQNIHAIQMEISQATYMDGAPAFLFREDLADYLRPTLKDMIDYFLQYDVIENKPNA